MRRLVWSSIAGFLFGLTGCTTTSVYTPEHLSEDEDRAVTVHTKDGASIRFEAGDYAIIGEAQDSIRGVGQRVTNTVSNATERWEGTIPLHDVASVTVKQLNFIGDAAWLGAVVVVVYTITHLTPYGWN